MMKCLTPDPSRIALVVTLILFLLLRDASAFCVLPRSQPVQAQQHVASSCQASQTAQEKEDKVAQEWDTKRYQTQHSFVYQYGASLIDLAAPFTAGERILDVGCGTGELTAALYERALQDTTAAAAAAEPVVMGMDADPSMIAKASEQYPHLTFFQADVRSLEMPGGDNDCVDLIFSNAALHWVPPANVGRAVASMARALKPGGRFVVEFGGAGNVQQIVRACEDVTAVPCFWYYPSIAEFSTQLQEHGIEVTTAILYDRPVLLEQGAEGMKNWVRMFGNKFFENIAPSATTTREQQIEDALQTIDEKLRPKLFNGSQWTADYRRIRIVGRKKQLD